MKQVLAEIITIGDEILFGQITDTNSAWMGARLTEAGIKVHQITSVSDNRQHIRAALNEARNRADLILVTGGLGPTKDDLTKQCLSDYFRSELVLDPDSLQHITSLFSSRGKEISDLNRQQAYLPANCQPLLNSFGTAPGMWFEEFDKVIVSMPGVPFEMMQMMTDVVLPKLKEQFDTPEIIHKIIQTIGIGESDLSEQLADWEDNLPENISLAYLPYLGGVKLRLTGISNGSGDPEDQLLQQLAPLPGLIGNFIFAYGEVTLEETVGMLLNAHCKTVATAESCTGGHVAHKLTSIPGSSLYFMGSIIAYDNDVKIRQLEVNPETITTHGAVSEEVVREMAENVRKKLHTDVGLATSGIAGPGGGTAEKPVGTIWIAYADHQHTVSRKLQFNKNRALNIEFTTMQVLNLLRQSLGQNN